jgi:hypothetical protein
MDDILYTIPHRWVVIQIKSNLYKSNLYKVFGTWYGGYLSDDRWRMNSGIVSIEEDDDFYYFKGYSNSMYKCNKKSYGTSFWTRGILNSIIEEAKNISEVEITILDENTNFKEFF